MSKSAKRSRLIQVFTVVLLLVCAARLFQLQIIEGPTLAEEARALRTAVTTIPAKRGTITDITGVVLAESVQRYHIAVNQVSIRSWVHTEQVEENGEDTTKILGRGAAEAAQLLAPLLEMDEAVLGGMMVGDETFVYLKKDVDAVTYRAIRALRIHGIEWEAVHERVYPNGNTAAPVIGVLNELDEGVVGVAGIEATMDEYLQGTPGKEAYEIEPEGAIIPGGTSVIEEPVDGATVRTTLHADLQHMVQAKLDERVAQHEADWGAVVVTEVSTGKVLVLADSGSVAPDPAVVQPVTAVQYAFEPGSVGKVLTLAAALEEGTVTPTTGFQVPDTIAPEDAGGPISDISPHEVLPLTVNGILTQSSNVGTMLVGETVSDQVRYDLMTAFGLGSPTGIELPGETGGTLRSPEEWMGRDRYVIMFGQAYTMNALQEATLMATIGNGGVRINPRIVDSWTLADGTVHTPESPEPVQVISSKTASDLLLMMESVVTSESGTGGLAQIDGYRVALKTGTAEVFNDGQYQVVSTAAGVVPADQPRLAIAVVLYNPKVAIHGGSSSAPLLGDTAADAVRTLGIPASTEAPQLYPTTTQ